MKSPTAPTGRRPRKIARWAGLCTGGALLLTQTATAQTSSVDDATGDAATPTTMFSNPFAGPIAGSGNQLEWDVPGFLLDGGISDWVAGSITDSVQDLLPDTGTNIGVGSTETDASGDSAAQVQDVLSAGVFDNGDSYTFQIEVRELVDPTPTGTALFFSMNYITRGAGLEDFNTSLFPYSPSARFFGIAVSESNVSFPYVPAGHYDLVQAEVEVTATHVIARLQVASAIPAVLPENTGLRPYAPNFRIALNVDGGLATGDSAGTDHVYSRTYDADGDPLLVHRVFNGNYFELDTVDVPTATIVDDLVTLTIPRSHFTLDVDNFGWIATVDLVAFAPGSSDPETYWFNPVDRTNLAGPYSIIFTDGFEEGSTEAWN